MSNSIAPGSSADVNVRVTALTTNPNVPVTYKTIILKKNLVNGFNTLTQEMMSASNTKYVIKYDYVLGENITVPANCVLEFDGGSISDNGTHTIICQNTNIEAGLYPIFKGITFNGTITAKEVYLDWFEDNADCSIKFIGALNAIKGTSNPSEYTIALAAKEYVFNTQINLDSIYNGVSAYLHIKGQGECSIIKDNYGQESYQGDINTVDYLFLRNTSGSGANALIDIKLSDFLVKGKTTEENNNQGFLANKGGWVNDGNIHNIKTWFIGNVLYLYRAYWVKIHQCCFREGVDLVYVIESNSCAYTNNQFRGCTGCGLYIDSGHGTTITGNDFSGDHIGLKIAGGLSYAFVIMGNYFEVGSHSQQNYEMILGDNYNQKFQNFTIANNSGIDYCEKWDANYYQFYGLVINGQLYNSIVDCCIAKLEVGEGNSGHVMLNEEFITEEDIKDKFSSYNLYHKADEMSLDNRELFNDNRYPIRRIRNLEVQMSLLMQTQSADTLNTKFVWEDINGKIYTLESFNSYDYFQNNEERRNALKIIHEFKRTTGYSQSNFQGCVNLESIPIIKTSDTCTYMFKDCKNLKYIPKIDTSAMTGANGMFMGSGIIEIPELNTSNLEQASYMFNYCQSLIKIPLLDFTNVTNTDGILTYSTRLKYLGGFKGLRTSLDLIQCRWLNAESIDNVIEAAYNWATNPNSYPIPSSTPYIRVDGLVNNRLNDIIRNKFTAKGWTLTVG